MYERTDDGYRGPLSTPNNPVTHMYVCKPPVPLTTRSHTCMCANLRYVCKPPVQIEPMGTAAKGRPKGHRRCRDSLGTLSKIRRSKMLYNAHGHVALCISNTTKYPAIARCHNIRRTEHARGAVHDEIGGMWCTPTLPRCAKAGRLTSWRALSSRASEDGAAHRAPSGRGASAARSGWRGGGAPQAQKPRALLFRRTRPVWEASSRVLVKKLGRERP